MPSTDNPSVPPRMIGIGAVFIDDIVRPDGTTSMGQLGGGVVHALMGAAVWDERPGINAIVGHGLPLEAHAMLERHFDTAGLIRLDIPQIRAWQIFEEDGTRRELYRVAEIAPFIAGAQPKQLPDLYSASKAFYLLQDFDGIRSWCSRIQGCILWEPLQQIMVRGNRDAIRAILQTGIIDIVSPNLIEARAVYGELSVENLLEAMFDDGARIVALRMGEAGSIVACRNTAEQYYIPAVQVSVVDQTGAGNTYCGALLWGIINDLKLADAAAAAAVSASFCVEQIGVLDPDHVNSHERNQRFVQCRSMIVEFTKMNNLQV
jgi:hypothetical protein